MKPVLSICITTYNQGELLSQLLSELSNIQSDEIEIVINDDCSNEDIETITNGFNDERFHYYENDKNLGHDRNILRAINNAKGEFVFILRTRDGICPESIPALIETLKKTNSDYLVCSAINEDGKMVLPFRDMIYQKGKEATDAHFKLFIHPSGNIYRKSSVNLEELETFLDLHGVDKLGFIVHTLIRLRLAQHGSIQTISEKTWIYVNTNKATDIAQNKTGTKMSVYHPLLEEKRFEWIYEWTKQIVYEDFVDVLLKTISVTLNSLTWNFLLSNSDKKSQKHYQYNKIEYSLVETRHSFYKKCIVLYEDFVNSTNSDGFSRLRPDMGQVTFREYKKKLDKVFRSNLIAGGIKYIFRRMSYNSRIYELLSNIYKTFFLKL